MRFGLLALGGLLALWPCILVGSDAQTSPSSSLPEPLTLTAALSLSNKYHPSVEAARANVASAEAGSRSTRAEDEMSAYLNGRIHWVQPQPTARNRRNEDHKLSLLLRKPLFDFGRTASGNAAASAETRARREILLDIRQRHYIQIMENFFDVLLADLVYDRENEQVAFMFTLLQHAQDRHDVGRLSDVALVAAESRYRESRIARDRSTAAQRASRSRLALSLNRPGQLSSELLEPDLVGNRRRLPDFAELEAQAIASNARLLASTTRIEAARGRIEEATAQGRPLIFGELEAAAYTRKLDSRDPLRVGVQLQIPLYSGDRVDAEVAQRRAQLNAALARRARLELELRQEVLEHWLELETLYAQREEAAARISYRELAQDQSLALFELERRTNLGDALVETSAAALHQTRTEYQIALTWAKLDALTGTAPQTIVDNALKGVPK